MTLSNSLAINEKKYEQAGEGISSSPCPIVVISNHGDVIGGGEISLLGLLESLDTTRWKAMVVAPYEGEVVRKCHKLGFQTKIIPLPTIRWPTLSIIRSLFSLWKVMRDTDAKVCHANGSRAMFYAGIIGRFRRCPVVWHVRVADSDCMWDKVLSSLAHVILVNSQAVANRFSKEIRRKVRCVYNGVNPARFSPRPASEALRKELNLPKNAPIVVSVGRFVAFKGYQFLLEAAALLRQPFPTVHWILIGDGELMGSLQAQCDQLNLNSCVHFLGWQDEIPEYLALGDIFVLPSLSEHFGRVIIEAMAMKKPVIATKAGGVPEIVEDQKSGLLVPPGNSQALAKAIQSLLCNSSLASELAQNGRSRVEAMFTMTQHGEAIEAIYQKLVGELRG